MRQNISIIDYGLGNIYSIQNAINAIGFSSKIVNSYKDILESSHLILPGVGSFNHAMEKLQMNNLDEAIKEYVKRGDHILGICLGMQLMFECGEENEYTEGLGLLEGKVIKFQKKNNFSIPQIQWNQVSKASKSKLMADIEGNNFFYFLHSYYATTSSKEYILGFTNYNEIDYISMVEHNNIMGVQFHPEKSGRIGLQLIKNFIEGTI